MNPPNFFVVGAAKSGTTSLDLYLSQHSDIYLSPIKEPHFFSNDISLADCSPEYIKRASLNVEAYLGNQVLTRMHVAHIEDQSQYIELFREVKDEKLIGELSTSYLYSNCAAENIFKFNQNAKIIIVLRQPVYRAYSHYLMNVREFLEYESGFISALERDFYSSEKGWGKSNLYVELGLYFEQVSRYVKRIPEGQIKIFLFEELKNDPVRFIQDVCEFLEVSPSALSAKDFSVHKNVAARPRFMISGAYLTTFNVFRKYAGMYLPDWIKRQVKGIILSKNVTKLKLEEFEYAMKYFSEDINKLSVLIKRDLGSWHQFGE